PKTAHPAGLRGEQLPQAQRVPRRERFPVVVEVGVDVHVPCADAGGPLAQLRLAVVAAPAAQAAVEAQVRPRRSEDLTLAGEHERGAVVMEQVVHVVGEPALVPELEGVQLGHRKRREGGAEALVVAWEVRRQLPEERPALVQRLDAGTEARDRLAEVAQPLHVRDVAGQLHREEEALGRRTLPRRDALALREPVERVVDLDGVEAAHVQLEPLARRAPRVEGHLPARVVPAGAAYADNAFAIWRHSSVVPAAAMRERLSRSSSASPNPRGSSKS